MDFGEVVRVKSKFLNDSFVLYGCVRRPGYVLKFSRKKDNISLQQMQRTRQTALCNRRKRNGRR